jgi:hypothetical protein
MDSNHALALAKHLVVDNCLLVLDRTDVEQARQVRERIEISIVDSMLGRARPVLHTDRVGRKASLEQLLPGLLGIRHGVDDRDQLIGWIAQLDALLIGGVRFHGLVRSSL